MRRDSAKPTHPDTEGNQFFGMTLAGWEEIRQALQTMEEIVQYRNILTQG